MRLNSFPVRCINKWNGLDEDIVFSDTVLSFNPCPAEYIKMPRPFQIISQSDYLIQIVEINAQTE